jgi:AcrR family transcriptional regulator
MIPSQRRRQSPCRQRHRARAVKLDNENEREMPIVKICRTMGIPKPTLYRYVRAANGIPDGPPAT